MADAISRVEANFYRAKSDHDRLDQLSRIRALTGEESRQLESAIKRMMEWGVAQ